MLDVSSARVTHCVVHRVGNRLREDGCEFSQQEVRGTAELHGTLLRHYLAPLAKSGEHFEFYHESDISLNAAKQFSTRVLVDAGSFLSVSQNIAKHLYSVSTHPSIAEGEFIVILFQDVRIDGVSHTALGLYKIEQRETFLDIERSNDSINLIELSGIPVTSIQKGALIVGGDVGIFVKESGSQQTKYWAELFLKARPRQTRKSTSKLAAEFVKQVCSRIDVEAGMSLRRDLVEIFSTNETLNYRDVEEVSERYLDRNEVSRLTQQLEDHSGFSALSESTVDSALLTRQARSVFRQYPLGDGIGLTIANPKARLGKCSLSKTKNGYRAIIDIDLGE
ncbi:nucleoid-associated protein [Ralstonia pseudosolanacearum]|nr:nucleoid-associated protein [Ralstonia pseudosolanacearum]MDO3525060.1 nucleoid-associated protein [Ralstonia pseudosolanacearum]MDO3549703.1 nucleoid-associated protein [Ralstonia pseudosolanacearum]MDO3554805.1 nucleoid-associated protein [Ralstonia pseudosolanacearum]MDO3569441.1 nucleoid-associated protein [Ralstonia pseudosolanacearum]MDO3584287.1 nucleoid-associated protein [Ralstonia pseudosolanacearum]